LSIRKRISDIFNAETKIELTEGDIGKSLLYLSIPVIITNLLQTAYNLADTFWLGQHSTEALAAVSFAFPIIFFLISLGIGISIAGSILVAQFSGAGKENNADLAASQTFLYASIFAIIVSLIGYVIAEDLIIFLGAEEEVIPLAKDYLETIMLGMIFLFGFSVFTSLLRGYGDTITPMIIMFVSVTLNIIIDPFLIFGWFVFPELGVQGAAIATLISRGLGFMLGLAILLKGMKGLQISLRNMWPDLEFLKKTIKLGVPASFELTARSLSVNAILLIVGLFPTTIVAAYGVGIRIYSVIYLPAIAISRAVETMTGQNKGAGKIDRAIKTNYLASKVMFIALSMLGIITVLFAPGIMSIFSDDSEVISVGVEFLRILGISFGFIGITRAFTGGLRGAGKTMSAALVAIASLWLIRVPLAGFSSQIIQETGIWIAFAVSNIIGAALAYLVFKKNNWKT